MLISDEEYCQRKYVRKRGEGENKGGRMGQVLRAADCRC